MSNDLGIAVSIVVRSALQEVKEPSLNLETLGKSTATDLFNCLYDAALTNDRRFLDSVRYFRKCESIDGKLTVEFYKAIP